MTIFLVACVLSLAILAITVFARRSRPNADAFAPIFYVWLVAFLMWAFGVLVVLIVLAVIAAIGGLLIYSYNLEEPKSEEEQAEEEEERLEIGQSEIREGHSGAEGFVRDLVNQFLDSRGCYISVLVKNSGDFPDFQGNGMMVSKSNDSREIIRALLRNEEETIRVTRSHESAGGSGDFVGEVKIFYSFWWGLDSDRQMDWQVYCYTDDEWFEELVYDLVVSHTDDEYEDEWGDVRAPCLYDGSGNEKSRVLNPDGRWETVLTRVRSLEEMAVGINFDILPPGQWDFKDVTEHYKKVVRVLAYQEEQVQWDRIKDIEKLRPDTLYRGKSRWFGYVVYGFSFTNNVVLQYPIDRGSTCKGNAVYVLKGIKWMSLKGRYNGEWMWKWRYRTSYRKVVCKGEWLSRVEKALHDLK